ncbi:MAG: JAB domain-containing protein [Pseudomonadales bacterium]|nr:JAB domain-containing protein [Pseudomonadales bacterium]
MSEDETVRLAMGILDRRARERKQPVGAVGEAVMAAALRLADERTERLMAVWMTDHDTVIATQVLGEGGIDQLSFIPRELARAAVLNDARGVILAHNHPNGDHRPSQEDKLATERIGHVLAAVGVLLLGSYVVAGGRAACCVTGNQFELAETSKEAT